MKKFSIFYVPIILITCLIFAGCSTTPAPTATTYGPTAPATSAPATSAPATSAPATTGTVEKPITLSFSFHAPAMSSLAKGIIVPWVTDLEKACGGRVKITQYAGGALLGAADAYDGVVNGVCDLAQIATEEYTGRFPLSEAHILPYMYPSCEIAGIVAHEVQNKYCADTEMKDVKILLALPLHSSHYLGNKPVEKLADFKGVKIRGPGKIDGMIINALGATPLNVSTADVFSALDRGLVDGTLFTWSGAMAFGLAGVTKYKTEIGLSRGVHFLVMNKQSYNKLPSDIKKIFDEFSTPQVSKKYGAEHDKLEPGGKAAVAKSGPITVLSVEEQANMAASLQKVKDDWSAGMGASGKVILDAVAALVKQYSK